MLDTEAIRDLEARIEAHAAPMVSLYAAVNPAFQNNSPRAILSRARASLRALKVPDPLLEQVLYKLESLVHDARTVAIFASDTGMDALSLGVDLPVIDPATGHLDARYGAPYLAPLLLALDEFERYGVIYLDRDRARFFEIHLGRITEVADAHRRHAPDEARDRERHVLSGQSRAPMRANRDDAVQQRFEEHQLEWAAKFIRTLAHEVEALARARSLDRLALMGPERLTRLLEARLRRPLRERVVAQLPALPAHDVSPKEVLERMEPVIEAAERAAELELLERIVHRGISGLAPSLEALQAGQLRVVVVPWSAPLSVYCNTDTGYVAATAKQAAARSLDGGSIEEVPLREAMPELALRYGASVELVRGESESRLVAEHGGLAGLRRW